MRIERFEIKEEHLKLLNRSYVSWDDSEFGAACIYPKKPSFSIIKNEQF